MSDEYPIRLYFSHTKGHAVYDEVRTILRQSPAISGLEKLTEIDFIPNVVGTVRIGADATRDLTPDEAHDAMAMLQSMAITARDEIEGGRTIAMVWA